MGNSSEFGTSSLGEVLFFFFSDSSSQKLFDLCLTSDQVTTPQNFCLLPWWFLNTRKPRMMWPRWLWGKQSTVYASVFACLHANQNADFSVCHSTGYQFQWEFSIFFLLSCRSYAKSADFARREDFPNLCFQRQTKRRQKDAKIPDSCSMSFPAKHVNLRCLLAVHSLIVRLVHLVLWKRSWLFLLPQCRAEHMLALS